MISAITNFAVYSKSVSSGVQTIIFEFDIPTDSNIGGYELYKSTDTAGHSISCDIKADENANQASSISTYNDTNTGKTYFSYTVPEEDFGRKIYYSIEAISTSQEHSTRTSDIIVYTLLSAPTELTCGYNNYDVVLSWTAITQEDGMNSVLNSYGIYRAEMTTPTDIVLDSATGALVSDSFTYNSYVYVFDVVKKCMWFGKVIIGGVFFATDSNRSSIIFDASLDYSALFRNLAVYVFDASVTPTAIGYTTNTTYTDTTAQKNKNYVYFVAAVNPDAALSEYVSYPIITQSITDRAPYLRSIDNSPYTYLQQPHWRYLKNVLTDHNYYNKNKFDIPYLRGRYVFKGYLGIINAKVDIYLNSIYNQTVLTDSLGNFEFSISLIKGSSYLQLHARDYKNIGFSRKSTRQKITTVNLYSFFAALGSEYKEIWDEIEAQKTDLSLTDSRFESFEIKIPPIIEYYRDITEDEEPFRNIAIAIYLAYEYGGYNEALKLILDAFQENIDEFDHYEVYYNNSLYDPKQTSRSFVVDTSTGGLGLERDNYYYGVTSTNSSNEESSAAIIRVDDRWWPTTKIVGIETSTGYYNTGVLYGSTGLIYGSTGVLEVDPLYWIGDWSPALVKLGTDTYTVQSFDLTATAPAWELQTIPEPTMNWSRIRYLNDKFVAVGYSDGTTVDTHKSIMYSYDGSNWFDAPKTAPAATSYSGCCYGNGLYVVVGYVITGYSSTGISYTCTYAPDIPTSWSDVAYGNGIFASVSATGSYRAMYSNDGINWHLTSAADTQNKWNHMVYGNNVFVAVATGGSTTNRIMYSTDGITWNLSSYSTTASFRAIAFGNGVFVAGTSTVKPCLIYSTDGINWTACDYSSFTLASITAITYGNGMFIAHGSMGTPNNKIFYSTDGITWYAVSNTNLSGTWLSLAYHDPNLVLVGSTNTNACQLYNFKKATVSSTSNLYSGMKVSSSFLTTPTYIESVNHSSNTITFVDTQTNWIDTSITLSFDTSAEYEVDTFYSDSSLILTTTGTVYIDSAYPIDYCMQVSYYPIITSTEYRGFNVITWPEVDGIELYNIYKYKGSYSNYTYDSMTFVAQRNGNVFVDIDNSNLLTSTGTPPLYTFTQHDHPESLEVINKTKVANEDIAQKRKTYITIVLYAKDNQDIADFQLDRLLALFSELIPPELVYRVQYCNDTTSEFLN